MSTVYVAPPYVWLIVFVILIYLGTVAYLWRYLRQCHPSTWDWLGSPILTQPKITAVQSSLYTLWFILGPRYASLGDPRVSWLVWTIRAELLLVIALIVLGGAYGLIPER